MIARYWRGLVRRGHAGEYVDYLRGETFPHLSTIPGFIDATILTRETPQGTEVLIVTHWDSLDAIARFAGRDVEAAVVPERVQPLMIEYDRRARHYEVIT